MTCKIALNPLAEKATSLPTDPEPAATTSNGAPSSREVVVKVDVIPPRDDQNGPAAPEGLDSAPVGAEDRTEPEGS